MKKRIITAELLQNFKEMLVDEERSSNTIEKYLRDIRRFADFMNGMIIDKSLVLEYKAYLENSFALTSANSMIAALNTFLKFVGWTDMCIKQFKVQRKTTVLRNVN